MGGGGWGVGHDELGYHSSAPKASAARGGRVYDWVRGVSNGHHDREKKKYLLQIDAIAFIV